MIQNNKEKECKFYRFRFKQDRNCKGETYTKTKHCIITYYKQFSSLQI